MKTIKKLLTALFITIVILFMTNCEKPIGCKTCFLITFEHYPINRTIDTITIIACDDYLETINGRTTYYLKRTEDGSIRHYKQYINCK